LVSGTKISNIQREHHKTTTPVYILNNDFDIWFNRTTGSTSQIATIRLSTPNGLTRNIEININTSYLDSNSSESGILDGAKVLGSWFSVFLTFSSSVVILPFVRVNSTVFRSQLTEVILGDHYSSQTTSDRFILKTDAYMIQYAQARKYLIISTFILAFLVLAITTSKLHLFIDDYTYALGKPSLVQTFGKFFTDYISYHGVYRPLALIYYFFIYSIYRLLIIFFFSSF